MVSDDAVRLDQELTQAEAAEAFGIDVRTIRRLDVSYRRVGRQNVYRRCDLETALKQRAALDRNLDQHARPLSKMRTNCFTMDTSKLLSRADVRNMNWKFAEQMRDPELRALLDSITPESLGLE